MRPPRSQRRPSLNRRGPTFGQRKRIVLTTTSDASLLFSRGFPEYLAALGWEVHIVSTPGPNLSALNGVHPQVRPHALAMERSPRPLADLLAWIKWIVLLFRIRPGIVVGATPKAALLSLTASWLLRVPVRVYHLYGLRLETTHGLLRRLLVAMERITSGSSTRVLAVSKSLADEYVRQDLSPGAKVDLLHLGSSSGVDTDYFSRAAVCTQLVKEARNALGLSSGAFTVGYVGRVTPDKGLHLLAEALERLVVDGIDVQLVVVGTSDAPGYNPFASASYPTVWTGQLTDTRPLYMCFDVLALPTLREGFPNVSLEAAAMELPVVTSTATGAIDSVVHGLTGLIHENGSSDSLASMLIRLHADPEERRTFGIAGRSWVELNFARREVWHNHLEYFAKLTNTSPDAGS